MTAFPERFATLEKLLDYRRSPIDGGWPQKLELDNAPTTIVSTALALEMLRIRGLEDGDSRIQSGLLYLAEQVKEQTSPTSRGEWTRYPAYALWGLMRYPAALQDPRLAAGATYAYRWLATYRLKRGGWAQTRRPDALWLPATTVAVHAVERLALYTNRRQLPEAAAIVSMARDAVVQTAEGRNKGQRWWPQEPGGDPCPGTTGLAVLTLARGSSGHREVARAGIDWLAANPDLWATQVHYDDQIESRNWRIFSFSLGMRALLHPCARRSVTDPAIGAVVEHFDALWDEKEGGWSARPGGKASTAGSYAVVSATHALQRAWPFDPAEILGLRGVSGTHRPRPRARPIRVLYVSRASRSIRVESQRKETLVEMTIRGPSQWIILTTLAQRHHDAVAAGSTDQNDRTVSLEELARRCQTKVDSVRKTIDRLQKKLAAAAKLRSRASFVDLIEDHVPAGTVEKRVALEEIEVRLVDTLPPTGIDPAE
jgi:hypothetical protein